MPNDFVTLTALTKELSCLLSGGKIEKIQQPEKDEIMLQVRANGKKFNLVISCNSETPRIHVTDIKKENPYQAPVFCMHLRKLIANGYINKIELMNYDRIIQVEIIAKTELKDIATYSLIFEMMGRYSNLLIINEKKIILDAVKQVSFDTATKRCILPSMLYSFPEQSKILPYDYSLITQCLHNFNGGNLAKYISGNISGLSPLSSEELCRLSNLENVTSLTNNEVETLISSYKLLYDINDNNLYQPAVLLNDNGRAIDYFIKPYSNISDTFSFADNMSQAIEMCIAVKDKEERQRNRTKHLSNALKKYKSRNVKKLQKAREKLEECEKIDLYRKYGELINCNMGLIKKGDSNVDVFDYYDENQTKITIPLNVQLSPSGNSQSYFKRYNKLKRTLEVIVGQIEETEELLQYADSIDNSIRLASSSADLLQLEEELFAIGALKKLKTKVNKSQKASNPYIYEFEEFVIMVGKNNIQNDKLTFKTANGGDLWLHILNYHGSHVIIFAEGRDIPNSVVSFAAELAAFYSDANNENVNVDYTFRRNVKRSKSGNLGMVTYTEQQSCYVIPNQHLEQLIEK